MAVNEIFFERYPDSILEHQIQVRPFNALKTKSMRNLNPEGNIFSSSKCLMWEETSRIVQWVVIVLNYKLKRFVLYTSVNLLCIFLT